MRKRQLVALLALIVFGAGAACFLSTWALRERFRNRLTVENRSGQTITELRITIGGQTSVFRDVPDGRTASSTFRIASDDHFVVEGRLADTTAVGGEFGYVTNGMSGQRATFVVSSDARIGFQQSNSVSPY